MLSRMLLVCSTSLTASIASAYVLDVSEITSPLTQFTSRGDSITLWTPDKEVDDSIFDSLLSHVQANRPTWSVVQGAEAPGVARVLGYEAMSHTEPDSISWLGYSASVTYLAEPPYDSASLRWIYFERIHSLFGTIIDNLWLDGLQTDGPDFPFFYDSTYDPLTRNGVDALGRPFDMSWASNLLHRFAGPAPYTFTTESYLFLADHVIDGNGYDVLTIHDGLHFDYDATAVPVPEPVSMVALGVSLAAYALRRRR